MLRCRAVVTRQVPAVLRSIKRPASDVTAGAHGADGVGVENENAVSQVAGLRFRCVNSDVAIVSALLPTTARY